MASTEIFIFSPIFINNDGGMGAILNESGTKKFSGARGLWSFHMCREDSFMMRASLRIVTVLMAVCGIWFISVAHPAKPSLHLEKAIQLPQVKGSFDLMAADVVGKRLFIAAQDNNTLEVLDLANGKPAKSISGLHQPKGIVYLPEMHKVYVSNKDNGVVQVFDSETFKPVAMIDFKVKANNIRYDLKSKLVYVGYGNGAIGIIDTVNDSRGDDIPLVDFPKQFRLESHGNRIFVNVPTANHIAVIDRTQKKVIATWPVTEARSNVPMDLDEEHHRLFIACDPGKFVVFNTESGKSVASLAIHPEADGIHYDIKRRQIYVSCGDGAIEVIQQIDPNRYRSIGSVVTKAGAGTSLFVPELDRLYLAVPQSKDSPAEIQVYRPLGDR
jgi:DNA-binding beta-propeller fold protein YncE